MDRNDKKGVYLQEDYFFVTQFIQKYRKVSSLIYNHQFAIGSRIVFGLGYDFSIGKGRNMLTLALEYETVSRIEEVTGIRKKNFRSSSFGVMVGIEF
jgi:hypothetical protein